MIWRILGTIGATSFFVTGFSVLSDPSCITADIGGGRVVGVTCRSDDYGALSGGAAGGVMLLIGTALLAFIYWNNLKRFLTGNSVRAEVSYRTHLPSSQESRIRTTSIKSCDKCGKELEGNWGHCPACLGTTFTHKQRELNPFAQRSEEAMLEAFPAPVTSSDANVPEFKVCPMCAEEIKFAAKKCRYCQHMMGE